MGCCYGPPGRPCCDGCFGPGPCCGTCCGHPPHGYGPPPPGYGYGRPVYGPRGPGGW